MPRKIKIAILFSGNGSNMQNIIETFHQKKIIYENKEYFFEIKGCICNQKDAFGITRARNLEIPCLLLPHQDFTDRISFDLALEKEIKKMDVDLVVLAGFMRILSKKFCDSFKIINIHPSLLPKYKGANAIVESFESGDEEVGVSVHWVNEELDGGAIILQKSFLRIPEDSLEVFSQKIHALEYEIYPEAIKKAIASL
ncbi:phosphoribosylglycinamide formyltransferase [Helicobacter sp. faydin-H20]|uniref:phosphoribosylglycinamide formyltransferase n=1 Tax=Helicobacter anatolicus TaxID=2905874 RepID=UPI001E44F5E3|nr:phosphoribosylglycinamide formyltransferase [Helicobacter anatolicus]MCE3036259.1 phosphoribosylglycinamide formyltransferase [Helicobacter anatolicus]